MKYRRPASRAPGRPSTLGRILDMRAHNTSSCAGVSALGGAATAATLLPGEDECFFNLEEISGGPRRACGNGDP